MATILCKVRKHWAALFQYLVTLSMLKNLQMTRKIDDNDVRRIGKCTLRYSSSTSSMPMIDHRWSNV